ncbi:type I DNA topoisomerase [Patescibacteria group bacterium]|nr:type I DNA topoisomerase [Patescibacteria group bacterium]MCG2701982.1 type I DNA topoisomerase [Candidatus Parcubacteria bacterium]MBU4265329.1 type I DNA topoisomerase [Patescibacteria group bacterium]MBU4389903.1 type I DNA topoisomerase [Patescibacteria group bacterium]MBU4397190.1 type I DNA topoisomerase [Patescibacteria group bacterium]
MTDVIKKLLIVESPTKAKTIGKYLGSSGKEWKVVATVGHLRDLPKSKMGVDLESFEPDYVVSTDKKKVIKELLKEAGGADLIYLATDPDREGEAIAWHTKWILEDNAAFAKASSSQGKIKRVSFHEVTKEAIEKALKEAGEIDMALVDAQQGRRVLDRVVGYSLSPVLWRKVRRGLSAGRVQSVAVRLICEREKEIKAFKSEKFYKIEVDFGKFKAELIKMDGKRIAVSVKLELFDGDYKYGKTIFDKKAKVNDFVGKLGKDYLVENVVEKERKRSPLPPFTTSKLQQNASRLFGWSGKQTMSVAQKLYEKGLITYHRTDSVSLSSKAINDFREFIGQKYGEEYVAKKVRVFANRSKNAQEAHEAIRPTKASDRSKVEAVGGRESKLYELIWKRAVAIQAAEARMKSTTVDLINKNGLFRANGVRMLFDGFLRITGEKIEDQILPDLKVGDVLESKKVETIESETKAPPRYTDASLVGSLEKQGIGRPSTYAPIIATVQARQYVEKDESRRFIPTNVGIATNDFLVNNFPKILSLPFTAGMEEDLDRVADSKLNWQKMMKKFWSGFDKKVKKVIEKAERVKIETEKIGEKCPDCKKGELVIRVGRFGKFISCDQFPECKHTRQYKELAGFKCPDCGADGVVRKTKRRRRFFGCGNYPKCKWMAWKKPN